MSESTRDPGLFACLYQPPLPGQLSVRGVGSSCTAQSAAVAASRDPALRTNVAADLQIRPSPSPLVSIAAEFSPRYEQHRTDLVSIDVRGLSRLFGTPRAIGAELRREAASRGVRVHVAIAPTRMAALVTALVRPGVTVVPAGGVSGALANVPLTVLDQVHEDPYPTGGSSGGNSGGSVAQVRADAARAAMATLQSWGLRTLGELAALPAADLSARLGRSGRIWQSIARGEDTRPLVPMQADERFEGTLELEWPIEGQEPLSFVLTRLLEPLSTRLERRDRGVAVLHVELHLVTREVHTCRVELPSPLRDVRALRTLALLDIEAHPPAAAIDQVRVTIDPTPGRILQHALFARPHPTPEQLSTLLARLGALMGQDRVGAPARVDSYRPGAFTMAPFAIEHRAVSASEPSSESSSEPSSEPPSRTPDSWAVSRDARAPMRETSSMLSTPSTLGPPAAVHARVPDSSYADCSPPSSALRRCRQPIPARVATDGHRRPLRVFTDRRGFAGGAVVSCAGPWRTSGAWWEDDERGQKLPERQGVERGLWSVGDVQEAKRGGQADVGGARDIATRRPKDREGGGSGPWSRDEWDVALADGAVYRIFRDRTTDGWFIEGVVD